jgi:transcriptional regulator with XRE-family HTH domain
MGPMTQTRTTTNTTTIPAFTIADRIRKAREVAGLDQHQLADVTGIARSTISNYERGSTKPSRAYVKSIGLATGVDHRWIWTGDLDLTTSDVGESSTKWYAAARPPSRAAA